MEKAPIGKKIENFNFGLHRTIGNRCHEKNLEAASKKFNEIWISDFVELNGISYIGKIYSSQHQKAHRKKPIGEELIENKFRTKKDKFEKLKNCSYNISSSKVSPSFNKKFFL